MWVMALLPVAFTASAQTVDPSKRDKAPAALKQRNPDTSSAAGTAAAPGSKSGRVIQTKKPSVHHLRTIDGERHSGYIREISAKSVIMALTPSAEAPEVFDRTGVWTLSRTEQKSVSAKLRIHLPDGSLPATGCSIDGNAVTILLPDGSKIDFPLRKINAISFAANAPVPEAEALWQNVLGADTNQDQLIARGKTGSYYLIKGAFIALNEVHALFTYQGKKRSLPLDNLYGFRLAGGKQQLPAASDARIYFSDKDFLDINSLVLSDGNLSGRLTDGVSVTFAWGSIRHVTFFSPLLIPLDECTVEKVSERRIIAPLLPWKRNRNVLNKSLTLGGVVYSNGIGMHADCNVSIRIPDGAVTFCAVAGIDPVGKKGDCIARIEVDGREVWKSPLRSGDAPVTIKIGIKGAGILSLIAEHGEGMDLGDYVNWCDARILKK